MANRQFWTRQEHDIFMEEIADMLKCENRFDVDETYKKIADKMGKKPSAIKNRFYDVRNKRLFVLNQEELEFFKTFVKDGVLYWNSIDEISEKLKINAFQITQIAKFEGFKYKRKPLRAYNAKSIPCEAKSIPRKAITLENRQARTNLKKSIHERVADHIGGDYNHKTGFITVKGRIFSGKELTKLIIELGE